MKSKTSKALLIASVSILSSSGVAGASTLKHNFGDNQSPISISRSRNNPQLTERAIFERSAKYHAEEIFKLAQIRGTNCFSQYCN
jgi:hypothetical protein